jgi:hypothetical protein
MTPDEYYSLIMFGLDIMLFIALILVILYIAYRRPEKREEKE